MIALKQLTYALLLGEIATATAYSQDTASEYVAPPDGGPKGKAPRMKVQWLNTGETDEAVCCYLLPGRRGVFRTVGVAQKYQISSAHFTAIGAVNGATLGWFDPQRKMYKTVKTR